MPYGDGGRPGGGPWLHAAFAMLAMLGAGATIGGVVAHHPTPGEREQIERCQPVVWHEDTDLRGWNLLREQGYAGRDDDGAEALYPPGCEGVNR